jgi:hypothetical protein
MSSEQCRKQLSHNKIAGIFPSRGFTIMLGRWSEYCFDILLESISSHIRRWHDFNPQVDAFSHTLLENAQSPGIRGNQQGTINIPRRGHTTEENLVSNVPVNRIMEL